MAVWVAQALNNYSKVRIRHLGAVREVVQRQDGGKVAKSFEYLLDLSDAVL